MLFHVILAVTVVKAPWKSVRRSCETNAGPAGAERAVPWKTVDNANLRNWQRIKTNLS